jgi:hypothetical protein
MIVSGILNHLIYRTFIPSRLTHCRVRSAGADCVFQRKPSRVDGAQRHPPRTRTIIQVGRMARSDIRL